jgi:hypothetical protein
MMTTRFYSYKAAIEMIKVYLLLVQINWIVAEIFQKDTTVVNVLCDGTDLGQAKSVTVCAGLCDITPSCRSFFYVKLDKICKGSETIYGSAVGCSSKTGSVYYKTTGSTLIFLSSQW